MVLEISKVHRIITGEADDVLDFLITEFSIGIAIVDPSLVVQILEQWRYDFILVRLHRR